MGNLAALEDSELFTAVDMIDACISKETDTQTERETESERESEGETEREV